MNILPRRDGRYAPDLSKIPILKNPKKKPKVYLSFFEICGKILD